MNNQLSIWPKHITVDKRIVRILSASTYDNFPNALKEVITNSYDADASEVSIIIDLKMETITIEDDGIGMSDFDFSQYLKIAGMKREKNIKTSSGRATIGQFGVGFLSVFPFFKNFSIETKIAGSDEILQAEIPCFLYFGSNSVDISDIKVQGGIKYDKSKNRSHYTKIKLSGFTPLSKRFFSPPSKRKPRRNSILNESSIEILRWRLSEDLPLKYEDEKLNKLFNIYSRNLPFKVTLNRYEILRKIYGKKILETNRKDVEQLGKIKFKYFICTSREAINNPIEGRYLKIRNLNVGVGDRTAFGLGTEVGGARSRLHWLSGEIHIISGMNNLITVSRDKFNYDEDYEKLKDFFVKKLSYHSTKLEKEEEIKKLLDSTKSNRIKNVKLLSELESVKIEIEGKQYHVLLNDWDYNKEFFSACRIEKNNLIINRSYPLFKGVKYTDIFIKLHLMLLRQLKSHLLNDKTYSLMSKMILEIYEDYKK